MRVTKSTQINFNEGTIYKSGYVVRLTKEEFEKLKTWLKDRKAVAYEVVDTYLRDNLNTDIKEGVNYTGLVTFSELETKLSDFIKSPYKSKKNRYFEFIITD